MIERNEYLNKLIYWKDKRIIKIITGIRRCGKSTIFELYKNYLKSNKVKDNQIISINFEDMEFEELFDYKKLYKFITSKIQNNRKYYIFLDEIQHVNNFQKVVDSLFIKKNVDVYITGSNAYLLSGELATLLSGRYIEIEMLPLSFKEYRNYYKNQKDKKVLFDNYLKFGGFPYTTELNNDNKAIEIYLKGIYNTVLLKDVVAKNKISDVMILENVIKFIFYNIGSFVSTKKITDTLNSNGRKVSVNTIENYLSALINCYILYRVNRFDIKGKQYLKTLEKYYVADTGLRDILITSQETDIGHILENVVYLELLRRGYKVCVGKVIDEKEIDFVAESSKEIIYYQVCSNIKNVDILKRELSALSKIKDNFPKYLITQDATLEKTYNGIKQINIIDWLLE